VPALILGGLTVVVSPLIALIQDQVAALRLAGVAAEAIPFRPIAARPVSAAWRRVTTGEARLLYLAPERLMTERMLEALKKLGRETGSQSTKRIAISHGALRSAPTTGAWRGCARSLRDVPIVGIDGDSRAGSRAHDIAEQLFAAMQQTSSSIRPAQYPPRGEAEAGFLRNQLLAFLKITRGETRHRLLPLGAKPRSRRLHTSKRERHPRPALSRRHGQGGARSNQNRFMTEPHLVMAATHRFAWASDKADVRFVFHMDLPASLEAYYQEIAARDARRTSRCASALG